MALDAIIKAGHEVAAVVTMPDKPAGRGLQLQQSAIKKYAVEHHLKVLQPEKLRDEQFISKLRENSYRNSKLKNCLEITTSS
jgi:methionyl-tRNA formyltransferase